MAKQITLRDQIIQLVNKYWGFDEDQRHTHSWHDKQDFFDALAKIEIPSSTPPTREELLESKIMAEYPTRELSLLETHLIPEMSRQELIDRLLEYEAEIERLKSLTSQSEIPTGQHEMTSCFTCKYDGGCEQCIGCGVHRLHYSPIITSIGNPNNFHPK